MFTFYKSRPQSLRCSTSGTSFGQWTMVTEFGCVVANKMTGKAALRGSSPVVTEKVQERY
jgi:hypothetical protein